MPAVSPAPRVRSLWKVPLGIKFLISPAALLLLLSMTPSTAAQTPAAGDSPRPGRTAVTNKQLEPFRLRREAQELEYERTRRARGLPSREELRRQAEEQDRRLFEWARRAEAGRREAELAALWSELLTAPWRAYDPGPQPSWAPDVYEVSYASPGFYPYFYAPPVRFGRYGRRSFGFPFSGRGWPRGARMLSSFRPAHLGLPPHAGTLPRVRPPATLPHRRPR